VTAVKVVDASALAALLFGEPEAEDVVRRLDGARLGAPGLLVFELANVCVVDREKPHKAVIGGDICAHCGAGFCRVSGCPGRFPCKIEIGNSHESKALIPCS
jgi:hypothetical protein